MARLNSIGPLVRVFVLLLFTGCSSESIPSEQDVIDDETALLASPTGDPMTQRLVSLARLMAITLQDDSLRGFVHAQLKASTQREGKLGFSQFTRGAGVRLLAGMAAMADNGTTHSDLSRLLDSTPALEIYLPVLTHRANWSGGRNLIVATSYREEDTPIGFDLDGRQVPLDRETPPNQPVLVIVPAEADFPDGSPSRAQCVPTEEYDCGGGGGGGSPTSGIYMSYSYLEDLHEPWTRGDPEIEVYLVGPANANLTSYTANYGSAGEYSSAYFNQDNHVWTAPAGSRGVLVANNAQINFIKSLYPPGTPAYNQGFALAVYEDDNTPNQIIEKHPNYSSAVFGASLLVPRIQLTLLGSNPPFISNTLAAAGFFILFQEVYNLTQLDDDFVGLVVDAQQWSGYSGVQIPRTHVVLIDNYKVGEINLQFYP